MEYDYIDRDYLDDYASYYAKCFTDYDRFCTRLHFFSIAVSEETFEHLIESGAESGKDVDDFKQNYLGFVVSRPLPDAIIGRTVLSTYESDNDRRQYPVTCDTEANLFGIKLSIKSLAFQEQDTVLAACATVSLWCAFHKTKSLFGAVTPSPAEITRAANQVPHHSRPFPSHGLNIQQICFAIRQAGLEPELIQINEGVPVPSLIYAHLRMGLPVILVVDIERIGMHAVTVVGYSLKTTKGPIPEISPPLSCIPMVGLRIDQFYVHDDQIGPFSKIRIMPSKPVGARTYPVTFTGSWKFGSSELTMYPSVVIIPVYHKIRLTFLDLQNPLTRLAQVLSASFFTSDQELEWDIHLITTNEYKSCVKEREVFPFPKKYILTKPHPKFIWRTILRVAGQDLLEMLFDATDMSRSQPAFSATWYNDFFRKQFNSLLSNDALKRILIPRLTEPFWRFLAESSKDPAGSYIFNK